MPPIRFRKVNPINRLFRGVTGRYAIGRATSTIAPPGAARAAQQRMVPPIFLELRLGRLTSLKRESATSVQPGRD
ncbi:MAG TPA: hypothetical protein VGY98_04360 [Verrucomicrobiae bacterium]|nr:hypothetical protein [Verrucomicrobiae bacterium]